MNQLSRTLLEGALPNQIRLRLAEGVELTTTPSEERALVDSLGIEAAVTVRRSDGVPLAGIARASPLAAR
jgi:hypothetical protein